MKMSNVKAFFATAAPIAAVVVGVLLIGWLFLALLGWATTSPATNWDRCRAIAKSQDVEWAATGWRYDTCYLYKDGQEEVIKL